MALPFGDEGRSSDGGLSATDYVVVSTDNVALLTDSRRSRPIMRALSPLPWDRSHLMNGLTRLDYAVDATGAARSFR